MAADDHAVLLTVLLQHDQSKTLDEIMAHLKGSGFYRDSPPGGSEPVSWVVAMSFGFIIQLRVQPDKVRPLNRDMPSLTQALPAVRRRHRVRELPRPPDQLVPDLPGRIGLMPEEGRRSRPAC